MKQKNLKNNKIGTNYTVKKKQNKTKNSRKKNKKVPEKCEIIDIFLSRVL